MSIEESCEAGQAGAVQDPTVLGLAGMELPFFTVAGVVLCFAFVMQTVSVTHQWFSYH